MARKKKTDNAKTKMLRRQDFLALDEAIAHWSEQLRKNPVDPQGIRNLLVPLLVEVERLDEASALIKQYANEKSAQFLYSRALLTFKKHGACPVSDEALETAVRQNPHVLDYICGAKLPAVEKDSFEPGSKEEAAIYLDAAMDSWLNSEAAVIWLADYLMEELTKFNHSMDFSVDKFSGAKSTGVESPVMDFTP